LETGILLSHDNGADHSKVIHRRGLTTSEKYSAKMYHWQVYIRLQKKQQAWWEDVVKENNKKRKECKMNKETPIPSQQ